MNFSLFKKSTYWGHIYILFYMGYFQKNATSWLTYSEAEVEAWCHKVQREGISKNNTDTHMTIDSGHGRVETRKCTQILIDSSWLSKKYRWSGLTSVIIIESDVYYKATKKTTTEKRWYISSLKLNAKKALNGVRKQWGVESMQWVLDMIFREDESRIRRGNGALAFNVMRKIALNLFKQDKTKSASIARKKKMASLDDEFRSSLLESMIKAI